MKKFISIAILFLVCAAMYIQDGVAQRNSPVRHLVETLEVGRPVYYQGLTIVPIYSRAMNWLGSFTTFDEAVRKGWLEIEEMGGGSVPQVRLNNRSGSYVYIMGGEIITGCKQDRLVGRDVLVGPYSNGVIVPVYCVEQGRWQHTSPTFYSKNNLGDAQLRSYAQNSQSSSQSVIWSEISKISDRLGVRSKTSAYQELYDAPQVNRKVLSYTTRLIDAPAMNPDTRGVLIGVGGKIISVDIFSNSQLFKKLWPKILKSSIVSALLCDARGSISQEDAAEFLRILHDARFVSRSAVDVGEEISAFGQGVNANALLSSGSVVHLAAFPQEQAYPCWQYEDQINRNCNDHRIPVMQR